MHMGFTMCPKCGRHGNLMLFDGVEAAFFEQMGAREAVEQLYRHAHINERNRDELLEAIERSGLPEVSMMQNVMYLGGMWVMADPDSPITLIPAGNYTGAHQVHTVPQ